MSKKNSKNPSLPLSFRQDVNTLLFPLYYPTKKRIRKISLVEGTFTAKIPVPEEPERLYSNIYFTKEDAVLPRPLDGKILKYLIFLAQQSSDASEEPRKELKTSAKEIAMAILGPGGSPGGDFLAKIVKGLYRLWYVGFHFDGTFVTLDEFHNPKKKVVALRILEKIVIVDETPGIPLKIRFTDTFYDLVVKSKLIRKIDFTEVRKLKSGIAQRLFDLAEAKGPGLHLVSREELFAYLGIVAKKKTSTQISSIFQNIHRAAEEVSTTTRFTVRIHTGARGSNQVGLEIMVKEEEEEEKEKKVEKSQSLTDAEKRKILEALSKRKAVKNPIAVLRSMDKAEIDFELGKLKESLLRFFEEELNRLNYEIKELKKMGKSLTGISLPSMQEIRAMPRSELFEKEEELKRLIKKAAFKVSKLLIEETH